MIDLISRVNPNYQKSIDAVSGAKPAEKTEKPADEAVKENVDTYVPEDKNKVEEDAGTTYKPNAALVKAMKDEQAANQQRFIDMMKSMLNKQGKVFGESTDYIYFLYYSRAGKFLQHIMSELGNLHWVN